MESLRCASGAFIAVSLAIAGGVLDCGGESTQPFSAPPTSTTGETSTTGAADAAAEPVITYSFQLSGGDLDVAYAPSADGSTLSYEDGQGTRTFRGSEIGYLGTPAGTLVTVVTRRTIDNGSTTFSILAPPVRLGSNGAAEPIVTEGITAVRRFSVLVKLGQADAYTFTPLNGTAWSGEPSSGTAE
jgi:hypothetical protein